MLLGRVDGGVQNADDFIRPALRSPPNISEWPRYAWNELRPYEAALLQTSPGERPHRSAALSIESLKGW